MSSPRLNSQFELFGQMIEVAIGEHPARSILAELAMERPGSGKMTLIDSVDPAASDDAQTMLTSDKYTREEYFSQDSANQTWDSFKGTMTPYMDVITQRTLSKPHLVEAGSYWREEDFLNITDPKSYDIDVLTRKVFREEDLLFGKAVTAATVDRYLKGSEDTITSVPLPASQALPDMLYSDITVDTLPSAIKEKFDDAWIAAGQPIYCAISSRTARMLRKDPTVHSADFVRNYADLYRTGGLPEIDGVTFIVLPTGYMANFTTELDTLFAWTPSAVARVMYDPFKVSTGVSEDHRFDVVGYLRKTVDFKRITDAGVVVGDITGN